MARGGSRIVRVLVPALFVAALAGSCGGGADPSVVRIPRGAGGVGFLPLLMMERYRLIETHATAAGVGDLQVDWLDIGGPAVANDALLSERADFVAAGPPAFLMLWDRTRDSRHAVLGAAAMTSLPMYLNTRAAHLRTLDDIGPQDKIAVTAIKVSIPAIVMQMYARQRYGPAGTRRFDRYTVSMTHSDGVRALLSGPGLISAHFTSPPFHQLERQAPGGHVRTVMSSDEVLGGPATFTMLYTTRAFRERRPEVYAAVLAALSEANERIVADRRAAAELLRSTLRGFTVDQLEDVLEDPAIGFTTTPENLMTYATFMHDVGTLDSVPASWTDLFFPEIHTRPGS